MRCCKAEAVPRENGSGRQPEHLGGLGHRSELPANHRQKLPVYPLKNRLLLTKAITGDLQQSDTFATGKHGKVPLGYQLGNLIPAARYGTYYQILEELCGVYLLH